MKSKIILILILITLLFVAVLVESLSLKYREPSLIKERQIPESSIIENARVMAYRCDDSKIVHATFVPEKSGAIIELNDGRVIMLSQTASTSGDRYSNDGESLVMTVVDKVIQIAEGSPAQATYSNCI